MKKVLLFVILFVISTIFTSCLSKTNIAQQWYFPLWAANAHYNQPIKVLDTESAMGRYAQKTKELTLKDLALIHGHLCDGLVISYVEIKAVLRRLFPDGTVDRTDLRVVSKNGPCWVDAASIMTGARINFGTLSIQPEVGDGFIIQKISTGEAYSVHLKNGVFPQELKKLETKIRQAKAENKEVKPEDIDKVEKLADDLSKKILNTAPEDILKIKKLENYQYDFKFQTGNRSDIINKEVTR